MKCRYCEAEATRTLTWLFDKNHRPARITVRWCGCDLMTALRKIWPSPYQVIKGVDYEWEEIRPDTADYTADRHKWLDDGGGVESLADEILSRRNTVELPIFLREEYVAEGLPHQVTYSTYGGSKIIGYVVSEYPLKRDHQGCDGAFHDPPNQDDKRFYSTALLIRLAVDGEIGLTWRSHEQ